MNWSWLVVGVALAVVSLQDIALYKRDSFLPDVVVVKRTLPDSAQICAERDGLMDCRSIGDLRRWLQERKAK